MIDISQDKNVLLRARRVAPMLPGQAVIPDGAVLVGQGRIAAVGPWKELKTACAPVRDLGETTLAPGLVNAHTHLELSHLGLPPFQGQGFTAWVGWLLAQPVGEVTPEALAVAAGQLAACGTAAVADIAGRHPGLVATAMDAAGITCLTQYEWFGFQEHDALPPVPEMLALAPHCLAMAGHALYSTHPRTLRQAKQWDTARGRCFSLHLAEHAGEVELLAHGTGEFADLLRQRVLPASYGAPGLSPVAQALALDLLDAATLAVHCVQVTPADIALLRRSGATVCLCPRSNALIGVGTPPVRALLDAGIPCCLGTDSLASTPDLDLWNELRALLALPTVQERPLNLAAALALVTQNAARVLGLTGLGRLAPGASARFALLPGDLEALLHD